MERNVGRDIGPVWALLLIAAAFARGQVRSDFFIRLSTGDSLDAVKFVPSAPPPDGGYPALLFIHGFGADKSTRIPSCEAYAMNGYLTLAYSVRGHGRSSGRSTIMGEREKDDFREVLAQFRRMPSVDSTAVGVVGSSQGGLHALWAAAGRMPVAAVSADAIVPRWASDMLANGSIRRTLLVLVRTPEVRYDPEADTLWDLLRRDAYGDLAARFPRGRDVDPAVLSSSPIPRETLLKWQDHYFSAEGGIDEFFRSGAAKKLYAGTQGHYSDADSAEALLQSDLIFRWFDRFLKRRPNMITSEPPIVYAYSRLPADSTGFGWSHAGADTFPPPRTAPLRLYLAPDSLLLNTPPAAPCSVTVANDYADTSYTFEKGAIEGFRGNRFEEKLPQSTVAFTSGPLSAPLWWLGLPRMHLFAASAFAKFPLHVQIYEVDPRGRRYFVNRINYIARGWSPGSPGWIDAAGLPHAHMFTSGSRIRIELTNIDKTNRTEMGEYPFVLPMFANASVTVTSDAAHPSYLELPVSSSPR